MYKFIVIITFLLHSICAFSQKELMSYLKFKIVHQEKEGFEEDLYIYVDNKITDTIQFDTDKKSFGVSTKVGKFNVLIKSKSFRTVLIKDLILVPQKITFIEEPLPLVLKTLTKDKKKIKIKYEEPIVQACG